jgi:hypothetical protein
MMIINAISNTLTSIGKWLTAITSNSTVCKIGVVLTAFITNFFVPIFPVILLCFITTVIDMYYGIKVSVK